MISVGSGEAKERMVAATTSRDAESRAFEMTEAPVRRTACHLVAAGRWPRTWRYGARHRV